MFPTFIDVRRPNSDIYAALCALTIHSLLHYFYFYSYYYYYPCCYYYYHCC
jgi:hypothetical protein